VSRPAPQEPLRSPPSASVTARRLAAVETAACRHQSPELACCNSAAARVSWWCRSRHRTIPVKKRAICDSKNSVERGANIKDEVDHQGGSDSWTGNIFLRPINRLYIIDTPRLRPACICLGRPPRNSRRFPLGTYQLSRFSGRPAPAAVHSRRRTCLRPRCPRSQEALRPCQQDARRRCGGARSVSTNGRLIIGDLSR